MQSHPSTLKTTLFGPDADASIAEVSGKAPFIKSFGQILPPVPAVPPQIGQRVLPDPKFLFQSRSGSPPRAPFSPLADRSGAAAPPLRQEAEGLCNNPPPRSLPAGRHLPHAPFGLPQCGRRVPNAKACDAHASRLEFARAPHGPGHIPVSQAHEAQV